MKISNEVCKRCSIDKNIIQLYSEDNNMDPKPSPPDMSDLTVIEQQLISRISPCINVHLLNHGGIGSSGYCVTFPQEVNEPAKIVPRLPKEIEVLKVKKQGQNDTSQYFVVRRFKVQNALNFHKNNNPAFADIIININRIHYLPIEGELSDIETIDYHLHNDLSSDKGPAQHQTDPGEISGTTNSSVLLPDPNVDIKKKVENVVNAVIGEDHGGVTVNKKGTVTIP
jgi:hypothetical protein